MFALLEKEELIQTIKDCAECLGVKYITEDVLEQAMLTWSYNPFNSTFIFKVEVGLLCIPTKFDTENGVYLQLDKAYTPIDYEINHVLQLLKQCSDEINSFVKSIELI
ncbi:MAG: hypothetical protein K0R54_1595 [Clostridiaceae bacterium]|nr:hypothetical protein [Clostridiaceae bacterium]